MALPVLCNLFLAVHVKKNVYFEPDNHIDIQMCIEGVTEESRGLATEDQRGVADRSLH
jgi:hypothetical protein